MPTEQAKLDYLEGLRVNLAAVGVDGFRKLVDKLGGDYSTIDGATPAEKAVSWVRQLDRENLLGDLVQHGLVEFPERHWNFLATDPCKYYIASTRPSLSRATKFPIHTNKFIPAETPNKADLLIFDLDCPPENWLEYLGTQPHVVKFGPDYQSTLFVQFDLPTPPPKVQLDGSHLSALLQLMRIVRPDAICRSTSALLQKMLSVGQYLPSQWTAEALNRQTIANISNPAGRR
jgi:hypothetical protein